MSIKNYFIVTAMGLMLGACGEPQESNDAASLNNEPLTFTSGADLEQGLKNGLRTQLLNSMKYEQRGGGFFGGAKPVDPIQPLVLASSPVDSISPVKAEQAVYDGNYWYMVTTFGSTFFDDQSSNGFVIASINRLNKSAEHIGKYIDQSDTSSFIFTEDFSLGPINEKFSSLMPRQLALETFSSPLPPKPKHRSILSMPEHFTPLKGYSEALSAAQARVDPEVKIGGLFLVQKNNHTTAVATVSEVSSDDTMIQVVNVEEPNAPSLEWNMTIEGSLLDSQQLGNTLVLITQRQLVENGLQPIKPNETKDNREAIQARNETRLNELGISDLVTQYSAEGKVQPLSERCLVQDSYKRSIGLQKMVNITSINLLDHSIKSVCVAGNYQVAGMTPKSIFITGSFIDDSGEDKTRKTVVHTFDIIGDAVNYSATGSVYGYVNAETDRGNTLDVVSVSDNVIRLVTTEPSGPRRISALEHSADSLTSIGPKGGLVFGGVGDQVNKASFYGENAFIWHYSTDLGVSQASIVDMTNDFTKTEWTDSNTGYMYHVGDHYALIFDNQDTSLYDMSVIPPLLLNKIPTIGVITQKNSIQFNEISADKVRVTVPAAGAVVGVEMLEIINLESGSPELIHSGKIVAHSTKGYAWGNVLHTFIEGDSLYLSNAPAIWSADWGEAQALSKPTLPIPCEREQVMGLEVKLARVSDFGPEDMCESVVAITEGDYEEVLTLVPSKSTLSECTFEGALDRMGNYRVETTVSGIENDQYKFAYVGGGYCELNPVSITVNAAPTEYCDTHEAPAFIIGVKTDDNNQEAACKASIEFDFLGFEKYNLQAIAKSEVPLEYSSLLGDDVQCVIQGPTNNGRGSQYGFDFDLKVDGYKTISAWSPASNKHFSDCLLDVKVFQAQVELL